MRRLNVKKSTGFGPWMNWPPGSSFDYWQGGLPLFINEPKHQI